MAVPRLTVLYLLVNILYVKNCSATPNNSNESQSENLKWPKPWIGIQQNPARPAPTTPQPQVKPHNKPRLTKRQVHEIERIKQCTAIDAHGGKGVVMLKDITHHQYTFSFRPQTDFKKLLFNMIIDNNFNIDDPYISKDVRVFYRRDVEAAINNTWLEVKVEYYKHQVALGRDKLALKIQVGNLTRSLVTRRWWRTHTYQGFRISTEGGANFLFNCFYVNHLHPNTVSGLNQPILLGVILGSCFLLVISGWVCYLIIRHPRKRGADQSSSEHPPKVPDLPASLLLGSKKVNKCPNVENIYEEFDESTLARLRQKFPPFTMGECGQEVRKGSAEGNDYDVPRKKVSSVGGDPVYQNEKKLSLMEAKIKLSGRDSVPESHYIEMHGILNRSSSSNNIEDDLQKVIFQREKKDLNNTLYYTEHFPTERPNWQFCREWGIRAHLLHLITKQRRYHSAITELKKDLRQNQLL